LSLESLPRTTSWATLSPSLRDPIGKIWWEPPALAGGVGLQSNGKAFQGMGFSPGFFKGSAKAHDQSMEGDGLQAVRYHHKTIAALATEGSFLSQPERHDPWNMALTKQKLLCDRNSGTSVRGRSEEFCVITAPEGIDGCPTFAPGVRGPETSGAAHRWLLLLARRTPTQTPSGRPKP
jgi:hypothetical protein